MLLVCIFVIICLAHGQDVPIEKYLRVPRAVTESDLQDLVRFASLFVYQRMSERVN